jgi:hypothetical protein
MDQIVSEFVDGDVDEFGGTTVDVHSKEFAHKMSSVDG